MDSQQSESDSFFLLDERIRRWIWRNKWENLREAQEKAIPILLQGEEDLVIAAPTSAGKTEAAFLPMITKILVEELPGIRILYISPLKALINDQFARLELLCEELEVPVHRWHGDVSASKKQSLVKKPRGILLITPESLEALLMRRGLQCRALFANLSYIVVDEIHSFLGNERGIQLSSQMYRLENWLERKVPRIGLSATISEPDQVARFLRPELPGKVIQVEGSSEIKAELRCFTRKAGAEPGTEKSVSEGLSEFFFERMRGHHNLVFCNSRSLVEEISDGLTQKCNEVGAPNEFAAHHGNLSKEIREDVERRLKENALPVTCVCTSTLEMGIDIGVMKSIGQIGPPPSVASLRQRVGRSGRRGDPSILRIAVQENELTSRSTVSDRLRFGLVQAVASVELMARGWCEPVETGAVHFSTCIQQLMSLIVERGGVTIPFAYRALISHGAFSNISESDFVELLRQMKEHDLIHQMSDGTILLGKKGERIAEHYTFYAAFSTPEEYRVLADTKVLGTLPVDQPLKAGDPLTFAGRRWKIKLIDDIAKTISVIKHSGKNPPRFSGEAGRVHARVRAQMKEVLCRSDLPVFLDTQAIQCLKEARHCFEEFDLGNKPLLEVGNQTLIFHWSGDLEAFTLRLLLERAGLEVEPDLQVLVVNGSVNDVRDTMRHIVSDDSVTAYELSESVASKRREKYDWVLNNHLLNTTFANSEINIGLSALLAEKILTLADCEKF